MPEAFSPDLSTCREGTPGLPTPPALDAFGVPDAVENRDEIYPNLLPNPGGFPELPLTYPDIPIGGRYCAESEADVNMVIGGAIIFSEPGQCLLPPVNEDGSSCCRLRIWQPNAAGFYFDSCASTCAPRRRCCRCPVLFAVASAAAAGAHAASCPPAAAVLPSCRLPLLLPSRASARLDARMPPTFQCRSLGELLSLSAAHSGSRECRQPVEADGVWWVRSLLPGDEFSVGWGPDDEPHIHWDLLCDSCDGATPFDGTGIRRFGKIYLDEVCVLNGCGNAMPAHQAERLSTTVFRYDIVL